MRLVGACQWCPAVQQRPPTSLMAPMRASPLHDVLARLHAHSTWSNAPPTHPSNTPLPSPDQLLNLQAADQFASHQLNRDTWRDPMISGLVSQNFVLFQVGLRGARGMTPGCCCNP